MSNKERIAESYHEAEYLLRMVIYESAMRELTGYMSATEVIAFCKREQITAAEYADKKEEALKEALKVVKGKPYLKKVIVARIATLEDVELSIKELLRATGIMSSVDDFILTLIG